MQQVIGLLGRKGAGKDTAANALVAAGWVRIAIAGPLYREVGEAFGVTVDFLGNRKTKETPLPELALYRCRDQVFVAVAIAHAGMQLGVTNSRKLRNFLMKPRSPRQVMQWWGTEYKRRIIRDDYWLQMARDAIRAQPDKNFVITDIRLPSEAVLLTAEFDGTLARVVRPAQELEILEAAKLNVTDESMLHDTETLMMNYRVHIELLNHEGEHGVTQLGEAMLRWAKEAVAKVVRKAAKSLEVTA